MLGREGCGVGGGRGAVRRDERVRPECDLLLQLGDQIGWGVGGHPRSLQVLRLRLVLVLLRLPIL